MPRAEQQKSYAVKTAEENNLLAYVKRMQGYKRETCLFLPSILALAALFNCSAIEVHDAMMNLIQKGYKMLSLSMDSPITLWSPQG